MFENDEILDEYQAASCFDLKKGKGRPKKVLNATGIAVIEALAKIQCTHEEIAAALGVRKDTLYAAHNEEAFYTALERGQEVGKASLRRTQFRLAQESATMAIWLGKQYLGQRDKPVEEEDNSVDECPANIEIIVEDASE